MHDCTYKHGTSSLALHLMFIISAVVLPVESGNE